VVRSRKKRASGGWRYWFHTRELAVGHDAVKAGLQRLVQRLGIGPGATQTKRNQG
jgi:hypothetical protein